jgi:hypothetical protein
LIPNPDLNDILGSLRHGIEVACDTDNADYVRSDYRSHPESVLGLDLNFQLKKTFNRTIIEDPDNHIKIYIETYMPHETVLSHMANSQEPILVTGDQSMSEAISLGKLFFYEMQEWKKELYTNFKEYCRFVLPRNTSLHCFLDKATRIDTLETGQIDTVINNIVRKTRRNDLIGYMGTVSDHIKQNHDLKLDLISTIKRMMVGNTRKDHLYRTELHNLLGPSDGCETVFRRKRKRSVDEPMHPVKKQKTMNISLADMCVIC